MPEIDTSIYNRTNYDELKRAQRLINDRIAVLDKAESCGIECQEFRQMVKLVLDRLLKIEHHFFTPPPTQ